MRRLVLPLFLLILSGCLDPAAVQAPPASESPLPPVAATPTPPPPIAVSHTVDGTGWNAVEVRIDAWGPGRFGFNATTACAASQRLEGGAGYAVWRNDSTEPDDSAVFVPADAILGASAFIGGTGVWGGQVEGTVFTTPLVSTMGTTFAPKGPIRLRFVTWFGCETTTGVTTAKLDGEGQANVTLTLLPMRVVNQATMAADVSLTSASLTLLRNGLVRHESDRERDVLMWGDGPVPIDPPCFTSRLGGVKVRAECLRNELLYDRIGAGAFEASIPKLTALGRYELQTIIVERA